MKRKTLKEEYYGPSNDTLNFVGHDYDLARMVERLEQANNMEAKKLIWGWIKQDKLDFKQFSKLLDLWNVKLI